MGAPSFRPEEIVRALVARDVAFILIGGLAARAHGSNMLTSDVDITPDRALDNLARLSEALNDLEATVRADGVDGGLPFTHDAESLAAAGVWNLTTRYGDLDISMVPSGTGGYSDLAQEAVEETAYGTRIKIAALADVIRSKQAANRPKDQRVLPVLREILATRHERERS
ncbi:hypothetical protein [Nocardioides rubriscoriae]|uniref:hypothetical protein n=1 Tax=Nocardioides rubriscoriae TaxID=642762 RepID=UPI0011E01CA8|nr:hypothetical protein [Nocardioides rubriscoriae]